MSTLLDFISGAFMIAGLTFFVGTVTGMLRFPDFYTRMHAAGKGDTLSTILILIGAAIHVSQDVLHSPGVLLVMVKILAIAGFIMLTSPTSTHALMRAGYEDAHETDETVENKDAEGPTLEELQSGSREESP